MEIHTAQHFRAEAVLAPNKDGVETHLLVVKATYDIPLDESVPKLSGKQVELTYSDEYFGDPGVSSIKYPYDFSLEKPLVDFLVLGSAHVPGGAPARSVDVSVRFAGMINKTIRVVGDRQWERGLLGGFKSTEPAHFSVLPLSFERAYGGADITHQNPAHHAYHRENFVGAGLHANSAPDVVLGKPLPNMTLPRRPFENWGDATPTVGFGPISPAWRPRADFVGTYDDEYFRDRFPLPPIDLDSRYHQAAPPDQWVPAVTGGESVELTNLHHQSSLRFQLPPLEMPVTLFFSNRREEHFQARPDTVVIEPDEQRFYVVWRVATPCVGKPYDLRAAACGHMSDRWWRRKRSFKPHYDSLRSLIAAQAMMI